MTTTTISPAFARKLATATGRDALELQTIAATRGTRRASMPANMARKAAADEARAWDHSDLAGILWEHGIRSTRAITWARIEQWKDYDFLTVEPLTGTHGVIDWIICRPDRVILHAEYNHANKGALHRILNECEYIPDPQKADRWIKKHTAQPP